MRSAAGGEAASVSSTPNAMIASTAPSAQRSTVHHHWPITLRSSRGTWITPPSPHSRRPARRAPSRGTHRRDARSSSTGPTRRRPATAAPPRRSRRLGLRARRARRSSADCRSPQRSVRQLALELAGEQLGRLADQEGVADAVEPGRERRHAALLRLAAQDPVDVAIGRQRARRGVGVGRLAVVDVDRPCPPTRPAPGDAAGRDSCCRPATISSRGTPSQRQAAQAQAAFCALWSPGRVGTSEKSTDVAVGVDQHAGAERHAAGDRRARAPPARAAMPGRAARSRRRRRASTRRRCRSRRSRRSRWRSKMCSLAAT